MSGLIITLLVITGILVIIFVFNAQVASALCPLYSGSGASDPWAIFCKQGSSSGN